MQRNQEGSKHTGISCIIAIMMGCMKNTKPKMDIALPMLPIPTLKPTLASPARCTGEGWGESKAWFMATVTIEFRVRARVKIGLHLKLELG